MDSLSRVGIVYSGRFADEHLIDGHEMGRSLQGASRTYVLVAHTIITGRILGKRTSPIVRCYVGPPRQGSVETDIVIALVQAGVAAGGLGLPMDGVKAAADAIIARIMEALTSLWSGRNQDMEKAIAGLTQLGLQHAEVSKMLVHGLLGQNEGLLQAQREAIATIRVAVEKLGEATRPSAREMVAPVGNSCTGSTHSISGQKALAVTFDMPTADALRQEGTSVGNTEMHIARVSAVDTTNGVCKFDVEGMEYPIRGKIADPVIKIPRNIYTHSLDTQEAITITVKPVFDRHGDVKEFYIMDAKRNE